MVAALGGGGRCEGALLPPSEELAGDADLVPREGTAELRHGGGKALCPSIKVLNGISIKKLKDSLGESKATFSALRALRTEKSATPTEPLPKFNDKNQKEKREIDLSELNLSETDAFNLKHLFKEWCGEATSLNLSHNKFRAEGMRYLVESIVNMKKLVEIDISGNVLLFKNGALEAIRIVEDCPQLEVL